MCVVKRAKLPHPSIAALPLRPHTRQRKRCCRCVVVWRLSLTLQGSCTPPSLSLHQVLKEKQTKTDALHRYAQLHPEQRQTIPVIHVCCVQHLDQSCCGVCPLLPGQLQATMHHPSIQTSLYIIKTSITLYQRSHIYRFLTLLCAQHLDQSLHGAWPLLPGRLQATTLI